MKTSVFLVVLSGFSFPAAAHQHSSVLHSGDPVRSPVAAYESAFRGYVPWQEQKLAAWKELNDEVHRVGGHVGIFRGDSAKSAKDKPASTNAPASGPATAQHSKRVSPPPKQHRTTELGPKPGSHR